MKYIFIIEDIHGDNVSICALDNKNIWMVASRMLRN